MRMAILRISQNSSAASPPSDSCFIQRSSAAKKGEAKECVSSPGVSSSSSELPALASEFSASSRRMDAQTATHLSQIYASGPPMGLEISFATTSCDLRQKEHRRTSVDARFRRMGIAYRLSG